jgi:hypothetical protein
MLAKMRVGLAPLLVVVGFLLAACTSLPVGEYSLQAYENATTLKAETLALVAKSGQPFSANREAVEALSVKIDAAYEFAAGTSKDSPSALQWQLMRDPNVNLFGGFVRYWQKRGTLKPTMRQQTADQMSAAFDHIICLEANKKETAACPSNVSRGG